jgi:hypothetical protein
MNNGLLPEPYYALAEPDVADSDDPTHATVALAPSPIVAKDFALEPYDVLARRITIRSEWEGDNVIAVIELVSRANKVSQEKAERFLEKSLSLLEKGIHLLIADLQQPTPTLRSGFHVRICEQCGETITEIPPDRLLYAVSFQVLDGGRVRSHVAPLKLGDPPPEMPIFLLPHRFVRLPLETTYGEAFESLPRKYRERLQNVR